LLLQNKTSGEITRELGLKYRVVAYYIDSMKKHLGVTRRIDLLVQAYDLDRIFEKLEGFNLTNSEKEVMRLALRGMMHIDICKALKKNSVSTVKNTIAHALKKIGVRRIVEVYHKLDPGAIRQDFAERVFDLYPVKIDENSNDFVFHAIREEKDENTMLPMVRDKEVTYEQICA
jgi:DNA-binding CsgD family transcriptional regulator